MQDERGQMGIFIMLIGGAIALVVLTTILLLGLTLVGGVVDGLGGQAGPINKTATPDPITGQAVEFEDTQSKAEITQVYQVNDSTGNAVRLTGADDSYVKSNGEFNISQDNNWSVGTWAKVNSSAANENMTALSADGRVLIQYNGSESNWSVWYYDEGGRNSYRVNISAPNQPGNYTWVEAWHNGTHLKVYRNTTEGNVTNTTQSSITDANTNSSNWHGSLDETRTFDDALNDSQRSSLVSNPIEPRKNTSRTARIMYDQRSGSTYPIYFTSTDATASNFTRVSGLAGNELTDGTDYTLDQDAGTITALANGRIDGAPVVWIDYEYKDVDDVVTTGRNMQSAYRLFGTAVLLIPGVAVLAALVGGLIVATQFGGSGPEIPGVNNGR